MKFASIAFYILALSLILWYSEAFVARPLVVSPARSANKQLSTTASPQHARVTALALLAGSKGINKIVATTAPQHARFPALRDDPKGVYDVVFNAFPAALLVFAVTASTITQDKVLAAEKEIRKEEKESRKEAIASERQ